MQCITHTPNNSVLVGGHQPYVFELDMASLAPVNKVCLPASPYWLIYWILSLCHILLCYCLSEALANLALKPVFPDTMTCHYLTALNCLNIYVSIFW